MVKCPLLNWKVWCSIHGHWVNCRSTPWARVFTQNRPGRGQISGFGLPLTAVTKNKKNKNVSFCFTLNANRTAVRSGRGEFSRNILIARIAGDLDACPKWSTICFHQRHLLFVTLQETFFFQIFLKNAWIDFFFFRRHARSTQRQLPKSLLFSSSRIQPAGAYRARTVANAHCCRFDCVCQSTRTDCQAIAHGHLLKLRMQTWHSGGSSRKSWAEIH